LSCNKGKAFLIIYDMRIVGISIDPNNLPTREQVYSLALNSQEYSANPFREKEINDILDKSGLWEKQEQAINQEDGLHTVIAKKPSKFKRGED
jgi:hypothetical protein